MIKTRIKLFVDAHCLDTNYQGTQTFVRELYKQLLFQYPELDIYFGAHNKEKILATFPKVEHNHIIQYKRSRPSIYRLLFDIPYTLKNYKFHYAHFQNIAPLKVNCKSIVTLHDVLFNDFKQYFSKTYRLSRNIWFGKSIKNAELKTTVSNYSKERICNHYGIKTNDIHVIPNGVSSDISGNKDQSSKFIKEKYGIRNFVLYVSRIEPRKNHHILLDAYLDEKLYEKNITLVFIGEESLKNKQLDKRIKLLPLSIKKMIFHFRQVDDETLYAFYNGCKLFVYPSMAEGFGIPPLEAGICNVPVICSDKTAMQDYYFFKPNLISKSCKTELSSKINDILLNPPSKEYLNETATTIKEKYCWKKSAEIFYQLLNQNI